MPKNDSLILALIHMAGCTHREMTLLFSQEKYSPEQVYDWFVGKVSLNTAVITTEKKEKIYKTLKKIDIAHIESILTKKKISIITRDAPEYPERLRQIPKHPYLLYVRWKLKSLPIQLAIVGSRKYSLYGKRAIEFLAKDFESYPIGIISGWAYGIDTIAHQIALKHHLYTISVFGCGVDSPYPQSNIKLFDSILESGGALISPFPLMAEPLPYHFPIRNVLVAGLSDGIIIPEWAKKSGTLITARLALEQNKDVFVVPWDIFRETSLGSNQIIIKWEAKPIVCAADILEEYGIARKEGDESVTKKEISFASKESKQIYEQVQLGNNTPDSIAKKVTLDHSSIVSELTLLEIEGHLKLLPDGSYECI